MKYVVEKELKLFTRLREAREALAVLVGRWGLISMISRRSSLRRSKNDSVSLRAIYRVWCPTRETRTVFIQERTASTLLQSALLMVVVSQTEDWWTGARHVDKQRRQVGEGRSPSTSILSCYCISQCYVCSLS